MSIELATDAEQAEPAPEMAYTFVLAQDKAEYITRMALVDIAEVMNTSLVRGKPISEVHIWNDDAGCTLVYDFAAAKKGMPPWKTVND